MFTRTNGLVLSAALTVLLTSMFPQYGLSQQVSGPLPKEGIYAINTSNGHYVTAVNGGGIEGCSSGWPPVVLNSNATTIGRNETFTFIWVQPERNFQAGSFALQTASGNFITAVNGGGLGGSNDCLAPFHTDAV